MKLQNTIAAVLAVAILAGCSTVGGKADIASGTISTKGEPSKSQLVIANDGTITGSSNGIAPSGVNQDAAGTYYGSSGPFGTLTVNPDTGQVFITSPNDGDVTIANLDFKRNPETGELSILADGINVKFNITDNITAQGLTYNQAAAIIISIAPEQRMETVQQLEQVGVITSDIAAQLIANLVTGGV